MARNIVGFFSGLGLAIGLILGFGEYTSVMLQFVCSLIGFGLFAISAFLLVALYRTRQRHHW